MSTVVAAEREGGSWRGRAVLAGLILLALALPLLSWVLGLDARVTHWGKLVHGVEAFLVALGFGWLLLGWRDHARVDLPDQLGALLTMFAVVLFGVLWEIGEFVRDWSLYTDVQKSNSDTMTDLLWNDVGAVIGAVLAVRLYCHWLTARQRQDIGEIAVWLVGGPSRVLDKHGVLVTIVIALLAAAAMVAVWFASRPLPGFGVS